VVGFGISDRKGNLLELSVMVANAVPSDNMIAYTLLYEIENVLREMIVASFEHKYGPTWYKGHLPGDALEKYRKGIAYERSAKWTALIPHHPIYYVEFADLRIIIQLRDNWEPTFQGIFARKEILDGTLAELEFTRNKVAHNRKVSRQDVTIARSAHTKLRESIGASRFDDLLRQTTQARDIPERLTSLGVEAKIAFDRCCSVDAVPELVVWSYISSQWWFDDSYLGHPIEEIRSLFDKLQEYGRLDRRRGAGYRIEEWVRTNMSADRFKRVTREFDALRDSWRADG
jgi:Swt1-like HEPN